MSDVFISYSRLDQNFVAELREALLANAQDVWIDWEKIPPSQSWWNEIQKGIARANNFVVVLSPHSMASPICHMEVEYARQLRKRIIPVFHAEYDRETCILNISKRLSSHEQEATRLIWGARQPHDLFDANDSDLKHIHYFFFKSDADFETRFADLFTVIRTDYEHKEQHTTLELRALEWERRGKDASFLLLDKELQQAQAWLSTAPGKEPAPTELHRAYINASDRRTRQLSRIRLASIVGTLVAVIAIIIALAMSLIGIQAQDRADLAHTQVAIAGATLSPVPPTLTAVAISVDDAIIEQDLAMRFGNGMLTYASGDTSGALQMAEGAVRAYPNHARAYQFRAIVQHNLQQLDKAIADFTRAIQLDPQYAKAYNARGNIYAAMGMLDEAINDYTRAIKLDDQDSLFYYNRGVVYGEKAMLDEAIADFTRVIELDPLNAIAYKDRGNAYFHQDKLDEAVTDYTEAIRLDLEFVVAYFNRGNAYFVQNLLDETIADYTQVVRLDPTFIAAYYNRGNAIFELVSSYGSAEFLDEVIADYTRVIEFIPDNPEYLHVYEKRGLAYYFQNRLAEALEDWKTFERLGGQLSARSQDIRAEIEAID